MITKYKRPQMNHAIGFCYSCDSQWDIFHDGRSEFIKHGRKTGHRMCIETAYNQEYTFDLKDSNDQN